MSKILENEDFECFYDRNTGKVFSDLEFHHCRFFSCALSITLVPQFRTTIRNMKLIRCEQCGCSIEPAILEEIIVDGFKTHGLFQTWGAVFKHVTLKGRIGRVMFSPAIAPGRATKEQQRAFDEANATYYIKVDWALDISEGEFEECDRIYSL